MKKGKAKRIFAVRIWLLLILSMTGFKHQINMEKTSMMQAAATEESENILSGLLDFNQGDNENTEEEVEPDKKDNFLSIGRFDDDEQLEATRLRLRGLNPEVNSNIGNVVRDSTVEYMVRINLQYHEMASQLLNALRYENSKYFVTLKIGDDTDEDIKFKSVCNLNLAINSLKLAYDSYTEAKKENKENDENLKALLIQVSKTITELNEYIAYNSKAITKTSEILSSINRFNNEIVIPRVNTLRAKYMCVSADLENLNKNADLFKKNQEEANNAAAELNKNKKLYEDTMNIMKNTLNSVGKLEEEVKNLNVKALGNEETNKLLANHSNGVGALHEDLTKFAENFNKALQLDASLNQEEEEAMRDLAIDIDIAECNLDDSNIENQYRGELKEKYAKMNVHDLIQDLIKKLKAKDKAYNELLGEVYGIKDQNKQYRVENQQYQRCIENKEAENNLMLNALKAIKNVLKGKQGEMSESLEEENQKIDPQAIGNSVLRLKNNYDELIKQVQGVTLENGANYSKEELNKKTAELIAREQELNLRKQKLNEKIKKLNEDGVDLKELRQILTEEDKDFYRPINQEFQPKIYENVGQKYKEMDLRSLIKGLISIVENKNKDLQWLTTILADIENALKEKQEKINENIINQENQDVYPDEMKAIVDALKEKQDKFNKNFGNQEYRGVYPEVIKASVLKLKKDYDELVKQASEGAFENGEKNNEELKKKKEELAEKEKKLLQKEGDLAEKEKDLKQREEELKDKNEKLNEAGVNTEEDQNKLKDLTDESNQLNNKILDLQKQNESMKLELNRNNNTVETYKQKMNDYNIERNKLQKQINDLNIDNVELKNRLQNAEIDSQTKLTEVYKNLTETQKALDESVKAAEDSKTKYENQINQMKKDYENQINQMQKDSEDLKQENEKQKEEVSKLNSELEKYNNSELEKYNNSEINENLNNIQQKVKDLEETNKKLNENLEQHKINNKSLADENKILQEKNDQLEEDIKLLKKENEDLKKPNENASNAEDNKKLREDYTKLEKKYNDLQEENKKAKINDYIIQELRKTNEEKEASILILADENKILQEKNDQLEEDIKLLKKENESLKANPKVEKFEVEKPKVNTVSIENIANINLLGQKKFVADKLKVDDKKEIKFESEKKTEKDNIIHEGERFLIVGQEKPENEEQTQEEFEIVGQEKANELNNKILNLQTENAKLKKENENLKKEIENLKKEIENLKKAKESGASNVDEIKKLKNELKKQIEEFGKYKRTVTQEYAVLQRALDTYKFRAEEYVELKRTMVNDGMRLLGLNASRLENASAIGLYRIIVEGLDGNARLQREGLLNMRNISVMPEKELSRFRQEIELKRYATKNQNKGELNKNMERMQQLINRGTSNLRNPLRYIQDEERRQKREQQLKDLKSTKRNESGNTVKMQKYPKKNKH